MNLLCWNCRGLGNHRTVWELCHLVKEKKPRILFLMETKIRQSRMQTLRSKLGLEGMFVVDPVELSGGLVLLWQESNGLTIQNYSLRHINTIFSSVEPDKCWKLTCFYGHPDRGAREESWQLLSHLRQFSSQSWLCVGDFNKILNQSKKLVVLPAMNDKW